ncbi:MAG: sensor histidine kinase [Robinsoniella sp.]|nr:sensor histidine kinase [Robinsoniella sp.]
MKKFGKHSFRMQLMTSLFGCLLFSIVIIGLCLVINIREAERSNRSYIERLNEQWATELDFMIESIDKMRFLHLSDDEIMRIIVEEWDTSRKDLKIKNELYMSSLLDALSTINSDVLRITVQTNSGNIYGNYIEDSTLSVALAKENVLYVKKNHKNEMAVTDVYEGEINLIPYSLVTFCYPLYKVSSEESLGTIYIDMDYGAMKERFDAVEKQEGWSSCILNTNGVIYSSDSKIGAALGKKEQDSIIKFAKTDTGDGTLKLYSDNYLIHVKYVEKLNWYLIQCVRKSSFGRQMRGSYLLALWVILLLSGLIVAGTLMMKKISEPIRDISGVMSQAATKEKKELNYMECREDYPAEIYEIVQGYNAMIDRIRENIIQEYANELNQKKTELQMLQYQINPHFLYNTLNTMSAIARLNDIPYIPDISESLSKIFYYNVKGGEIVTLQEELENLQNYIRIQMIRFPEKFEVSYHISSGLERCRMLKFLLQPLVENAIDHGGGKKRGKMQILIEVRKVSKEEAEMNIYDNGVGIPQEELKRLQNILKEDEKDLWDGEKKKIGIRNVHMRIQNYYGKKYGVTVESEVGKGTRVCVTLPMTAEKMEETEYDESHCGG